MKIWHRSKKQNRKLYDSDDLRHCPVGLSNGNICLYLNATKEATNPYPYMLEMTPQEWDKLCTSVEARRTRHAIQG